VVLSDSMLGRCADCGPSDGDREATALTVSRPSSGCCEVDLRKSSVASSREGDVSVSGWAFFVAVSPAASGAAAPAPELGAGFNRPDMLKDMAACGR
jgi:hypothetical protein